MATQRWTQEQHVRYCRAQAELQQRIDAIMIQIDAGVLVIERRQFVELILDSELLAGSALIGGVHPSAAIP